jgi:hypothetical protein
VIAEMQEAENTTLMCDKCKVYLKPAKTTLSYLGNNFFTELPRCPVCGQAYLSEELAKGKIAEVEKLLEDK